MLYIPSPPSTSSTSPVMNDGLVGAEEAYRPGHVLRLAEPAERRALQASTSFASSGMTSVSRVST